MAQATAYLASKPHYEILDGLRGVAALMVIVFHLFEAHAGGNHFIQIINHGYLAVDFFFMLSGFVIGYAYDDRWDRIPQIAGTPVAKLVAIMLLGCTLLPLPLKWDVRGWTEMHPLNGPAWSLYYEYIANILYALVVRRFSKTLLWIFVVLAACATTHHLLTTPMGDMVGGWALNLEQQKNGLIRLLYPFFGGLLLFRMGWIMPRIKHAFLYSSLLIVLVLSLPRIGGEENVWANGLYEALCIIFIFPLIVSIGAGGRLTGKHSSRICKFLGDISYPIYITHYPIVYVYTAWVSRNDATMAEGAPYMLLVFVAAVALAYACLRLYDLPLRNWLTNRFLKKKIH